MNEVLQSLSDTIAARLNEADSHSSYIASLREKGLDKMLEKLGEEAIETILAAKHSEQSKSTDKLVHESADLLFHLLVVLGALDTDINAVLQELENRFGVSGLEEKRERPQQENG